MAQQPTQVGGAQGAQPPSAKAVTSPEPWSVAHITVAVSVGEFTLGVGRSRMLFDPSNNVTQGVEWFASLSLSPPVARQLLEALKVAIEGYEQTNGKIPFQPTTMKKIAPKT